MRSIESIKKDLRGNNTFNEPGIAVFGNQKLLIELLGDIREVSIATHNILASGVFFSVPIKVDKE